MSDWLKRLEALDPARLAGMRRGVEKESPRAAEELDDEELDDDSEEISIFVTDANTVWVQGSDWEIELTPQQAREMADALREVATEAEQPSEQVAASQL